MENETKETELLSKKHIEKARFIFIVGTTGSGKTALTFRFLQEYDKPVYILKHPKPSLLKPFGYINLKALTDIVRLRDCVVYIDEPQLLIQEINTPYNKLLSKVISLARHRNITLIMSTSDTRSITPQLESYIDLLLIKNIDYETTKQRSLIRRVLKENSVIAPCEIRLNKNEFIAHSQVLEEFNGFNTFELPKDWSASLSFAYN